MIGTFRKHSKALWIIIIAVIIIVFVYWGSPTSRTGDITPARDGSHGVMNGESITDALFQDTLREVRLYYFFSNGRWPGRGQMPDGFDEMRETYQRLFLIQKAREMGIYASDEVVAQTASARMRALNRGNPVMVDEFEKQLLAPERMSFADFERFIRHEVAIQQLFSVLTAAGELVPLDEIETLYRREFQPVSAQAIVFRATNDLTSIPAPEEKLREFYTNRLSYYRLPERAIINYVSFPLSNYLATAQQEFESDTNREEMVELYYEQRGTNDFPDAKTPEEVKQRIREEMVRGLAANAAIKAANDFDMALYEKANNATYSSELFVNTAKEFNLTPQVSEPFSISQPPVGFDVRAEFARRAFALNSEEPLTEPLGGENNIYVIGYHSHLPSEVPAFETIKDRVTQDYRFVEAATAAQQAAMDFVATATNSLQAGKSFADVAKAAGVQPIRLQSLTRNTRQIPELTGVLNDQYVQFFVGSVFATEPGQLTSLLPSSDGAVLAFVEARLPVDEAEMRTNLPAFTRSVQQARRNEILNEWFQAEASKAFASLPYFQQQQSQMSGGNPAAQ